MRAVTVLIQHSIARRVLLALFPRDRGSSACEIAPRTHVDLVVAAELATKGGMAPVEATVEHADSLTGAKMAFVVQARNARQDLRRQSRYGRDDEREGCTGG